MALYILPHKTPSSASLVFLKVVLFTVHICFSKGKLLFTAYALPAAAWLSFYQPPTVLAVGGLNAKVISAKILRTGQKLEFTQDATTLRITGLPETAPDELVTVLEVECDAPPVVDHHSIRPEWKRYKVDTISS